MITLVLLLVMSAAILFMCFAPSRLFEPRQRGEDTLPGERNEDARDGDPPERLTLAA